MNFIFRLLGEVAAIAVLCLLLSCYRQKSLVVVVHVWRNSSSSFADVDRRIDRQYAKTKPHVNSGKMVVIADKEISNALVEGLGETYYPEILVVESAAQLPEKATIRREMGNPHPFCGDRAAYIPSPVAGEAREASETYLRFVVAHCGDHDQPKTLKR